MKQDWFSTAKADGQGTLLLAVAGLTTLLIFKMFPAMDLGVSSLFCTDLAARICFQPEHPWLAEGFRRLFYWVPVVALGAILVDMAITWFRDGWKSSHRLRKQALVVSGFFLGTILVVNAWLKAFSGRPRPYQTVEFGGLLDFVPAGDFSGACVSNCSFVSGEAAAAGWLICVIPLLRGRFRTLIAAFLIDVSIAAPLLRVAMGGHYLSDAILGWIIGACSCGMALLLAQAMERATPPALDKAQ